MTEFGRLPAFIVPSCADHTDQQAGQDGGKQDHLIRASAIRRARAEHQHGKCQEEKNNSNVILRGFRENSSNLSKSLFHESPS